MKAKFYLDGGQAKVKIDDEWNALSLFLESDASFAEVVKHVELKKQREWIGNTSIVRPIAGGKYEVSTPLDMDLKSVEVNQKQLLKLIEAWHLFKENNVICVVNV